MSTLLYFLISTPAADRVWGRGGDSGGDSDKIERGIFIGFIRLRGEYVLVLMKF